jgi:hypothetical protein
MEDFPTPRIAADGKIAVPPIPVRILINHRTFINME